MSVWDTIRVTLDIHNFVYFVHCPVLNDVNFFVFWQGQPFDIVNVFLFIYFPTYLGYFLLQHFSLWTKGVLSPHGYTQSLIPLVLSPSPLLCFMCTIHIEITKVRAPTSQPRFLICTRWK